MLLLQVYLESIKEPFQHLCSAYLCKSLKSLVAYNKYQLNLRMPTNLPALPTHLSLPNVPFSIIDLSKSTGLFQKNKLSRNMFETLSNIYILVYFIDTGPSHTSDPIAQLADLVNSHFPHFGYKSRVEAIVDIQIFEEMFLQSLYAYIFMMAKPYAALPPDKLKEIAEQRTQRRSR